MRGKASKKKKTKYVVNNSSAAFKDVVNGIFFDKDDNAYEECEATESSESALDTAAELLCSDDFAESDRVDFTVIAGKADAGKKMKNSNAGGKASKISRQQMMQKLIKRGIARENELSAFTAVSGYYRTHDYDLRSIFACGTYVYTCSLANNPSIRKGVIVDVYPEIVVVQYSFRNGNFITEAFSKADVASFLVLEAV